MKIVRAMGNSLLTSKIVNRLNHRSIAHPSKSIAFQNKYNFVNLPINSHYYHIQLPNTLQPTLILIGRESKLNEKCYLIQHATELILKDPKICTETVKKRLVKELSLWEGGSGRFQKIATVAWVIRKLELRDKLGGLYEDLVKRIDEDQWYVNFDQSIKAMEAFSDYAEPEVRDRLYEKIERNMGLTLSDVNMVYYQRITQALLEAQRYRSPLWEKIETHVLRNLGMEYTPKVFFDIFKAFAISRNGTDVFYEVAQQVIFRGHLYQRAWALRSNLTDYDANGQFFALLAQTYAVVQEYTPLRLQPDFLDYMYKSMKASRLEYRDISTLSTLLKSLPSIGFHEDQIEDIVQDIVNNKSFSNYASLAEIEELYGLLQTRYGKVPSKVIAQIERLVLLDIKRKLLPIPRAIEIVNFLLSHRQEGEGQQMTEQLNTYMQKRFKYLQPQQLKQTKMYLQDSPKIITHLSPTVLQLT